MLCKASCAFIKTLSKKISRIVWAIMRASEVILIAESRRFVMVFTSLLFSLSSRGSYILENFQILSCEMNWIAGINTVDVTFQSLRISSSRPEICPSVAQRACHCSALRAATRPYSCTGHITCNDWTCPLIGDWIFYYHIERLRLYIKTSLVQFPGQ